MSKDTVKLYQRARAALQKEQAELSKTLAEAQATAADAEKRLSEIEATLGGSGSAPAKRRGRKPRKTAAKRGRSAKKKAAPKRKVAKRKTAKKAVKKPAKKAPKNANKAVKKTARKAAKGGKKKRSLKEVALQLTKGKALTAAQILQSAKKAGHKFGGKNPINGLRVMLYSNKKAFKNNKGKFTAA